MKFDVSGYNLDNLIKTLHIKKIPIYDLKLSKKHLSFTVQDKHIKKVKRLIANFKVKTALTGIKKLPKFMLANIGVILGVFFGTILSIFASSFTWQIIVYGTKDLSVNEIVQVLNNNGVKTGKVNTISSEDIETILLNNYDRIAQASVIKKGSAIIINISEKLVYQQTEFEPIRAKYSGIVESIKIITGTNNVKVGDYVNMGDILVLPFNLDSNGEKVSVQPKAEISGKIFVNSKAELARHEKVLTRTGKRCVEYNYKLFNLNLFSGKGKNSFAIFETNVYNENISDLIPLTRQVCEFFELAPTNIEHNFSLEKESLIEKSKALAYSSLPVGEIIAEKTDTAIIDDFMYAITSVTLSGIIND